MGVWVFGRLGVGATPPSPISSFDDPPVLDKVTQLLICVAFQFVIFSQFMLPVLKQPSLPFWLACMKLAMPSFIVWLLGECAHCGVLLIPAYPPRPPHVVPLSFCQVFTPSFTVA